MYQKILLLVFSLFLSSESTLAEIVLNPQNLEKISVDAFDQSLNFKSEDYIVRLFVSVCIKSKLNRLRTVRALKINGYLQLGKDQETQYWVHPDGRPAVNLGFENGRYSSCSLVIGKPPHKMKDPVDLLDELTKEDWTILQPSEFDLKRAERLWLVGLNGSWKYMVSLYRHGSKGSLALRESPVSK